MSNPAFLLADLLESWLVPAGQTVVAARRENTHGDGFWTAHGRAVGYINEISSLIRVLENEGDLGVAAYSPSLPKWYEGVFLSGRPWNLPKDNAERAIGEEDLRFLRAFGAYIDSKGFMAEAQRMDVDALAARLDEAQILTEQLEDELGVELAAYIRALIGEAGHVLDQRAYYSAGRLRSVAIELGGAFVASGAKLESAGDERGRELLAMGVGFMGDVIVEASASGVVEVGQTVLKAITGG